MLKESSPIQHILSFIPPESHHWAQMIWNAGVAHGTAITDQAHAILDEPEFKLSKYLLVPIEVIDEVSVIKPAYKLPIKPDLRDKFNYHFYGLKKIIEDKRSYFGLPVDRRRSPERKVAGSVY